MTQTDPFIGQTIGTYRIKSHLARGGMADVYVADDLQLKREVIIKVLLSALAQDDTFTARFQREAQTTARLNHPNIVQIYSTGLTANQRPYLAMQYVRGGSLSQQLRALAESGEMFTTIAALSLARQIADALTLAHQAGIVHRDLKPSNILLHPNGAPVLADLGIAAIATTVTTTSRLTRTGDVMGTPHYMSPEQAAGQSVDGRSDLYALGIILYELLAGSVPFDADSPLAILHKHVYEPFLPIEQLRPDLSPVTVAIINKCLQKDPDDRYQHAAELTAALDRAIALESGTAVPTTGDAGWKALFGQRLRRSQVLQSATADTAAPGGIPRWVLAVVPLLLILLAGYFLWPDGAGGGNGNEENNALSTTAATQPADAVAELPAVTGTATEAAVTATLLPTVSPMPPTTTPMATATTTPTPDTRQNKIIFQSNRDGDYDIYIMDSDGRNQLNLTNNSADDNYPVVSPDGRRVLFESIRDGNWEVYAIDSDGRNVQRLTNAPGSRDRLPTWSPDGSQVAFISDRDGDYDIYIMNADGSNVRQVTANTIREGHMSWSVNDTLAYNAGPTTAGWEIYTIDVDGRNQRQLTDNSHADWAPEWSPDGSRLIYISLVRTTDPGIYTMNADGSNQRLLYNSPDYEWGADWNSDGSAILFTVDVGDTDHIYTMNPDGSGALLLTNSGSYPSWVR